VCSPACSAGNNAPKAWEAALAADTNRQLVETFFNVMWNTWSEKAARAILTTDIDFRGSIGLHVSGHDGFLGYMQTIRDAFPDFHNHIEEIIATDERAVARLTYSGTHQGELLGRPATGRRIEYAGVAMFTMEGERISKVWVLGDLRGLMQQLDGDNGDAG
jgi:steroid delta-isomerase-like uncharacterized protein